MKSSPHTLFLFYAINIMSIAAITHRTPTHTLPLSSCSLVSHLSLATAHLPPVTIKMSMQDIDAALVQAWADLDESTLNIEACRWAMIACPADADWAHILELLLYLRPGLIRRISELRMREYTATIVIY